MPVPTLTAGKTKAGRDVLERTSGGRGRGERDGRVRVVREGFSEEVTFKEKEVIDEKLAISKAREKWTRVKVLFFYLILFSSPY